MIAPIPTRGVRVLCICACLANPRVASCEAPFVQHRAIVRDVALGEGGALNGVVVDRQGNAVQNARVRIIRNAEVIAETGADAEGRFRVANLTGGVYQVTSPQGAAVFRLWAPATAPPSARAVALVIDQGTLVRGQGAALAPLAVPAVTAAVVAAAAAIAVTAATNDDCDAS